jgi:Tol biopolymer transport system component/DNA-binding winged helix-turn-helix (wHTH) protein
MQNALPIRVQLGAFECDLKAGEFRKGEQKIRLQEQPFQILRLLIERSGDLVTLDEIKKRLWPNDTVVEFDHSIHTAMKKLRQAFGDSADDPKYIETVARRGYRLLVPVACLESTPGDSAAKIEVSTSNDDHVAKLQFALTGLTGRIVSHYRVLDVIGGGGMGVVYRAEDLKLGRAVALKFLPEELGNDPRALERFGREARAASSLDHPNICPIYEFGEHEGRPFIVMQLLEGQTLRDRLSSANSRETGISVDQLLDIALQITEGLESAHAKGIIHRDIKPANIFITNRGVAKILDFGLVKLLEAGEHEEVAAQRDDQAGALSRVTTASAGLDLTRTGAAMGTAGYMSPEQVKGEKLDARTDLFSFGLILYEMATGKRAFGAETAPILHDAILNHTPVHVLELNPSVPPKLERIINRALEKDREQRYRRASEIGADLSRLIPRQSRSGVRRGLAAGGVTALLVLAGVGLWRVKRQTPFLHGVAELKQTQLTANTSDNPVRDQVISPDGKLLAYSDTKGIHVKFVATGETQTLPLPEALKGLHVDWRMGPWFHDNMRFFANSFVAGQRHSTWTFSLIGGAPRKLRDDAYAQDISPDGSLVAFTTNPGKIGDSEIWLMDSNGEQAHRLYGSDENSDYENVQWSPNGQRLAYFRFHQTPAKWEEFVESRDLQGGPPTTILSSGPWWRKGGLRNFVWLPGGRVVYILGDDDLNGFSCNYWEILVDEHTGEPRSQPRQLTNWAGFCVEFPSATADGKRLAYGRFSLQRNVEVADLDSSGTHISNQKRLTTSEGNEYPMAWTADSKAVIFHSNRNGSMGIFKQSLDEETPEAIVTVKEDSAPAASVLSPDGLSLIYNLLPKGQGGTSSEPSRIMRVPVSGGVPQLLMTTPLSGPLRQIAGDFMRDCREDFRWQTTHLHRPRPYQRRWARAHPVWNRSRHKLFLGSFA